jgi:hypothetical protein
MFAKVFGPKMPFIALIFIVLLLFLFTMCFGICSFLKPEVNWGELTKEGEWREQRNTARCAWIVSLLLLITSHWLCIGGWFWPYKDIEKRVFILSGAAFIDKLDYQSTERDWPIKQNQRINLNKELGQQFKEGDKVTLRIYEPWYGWLYGGEELKVNNVYVR